MKQANQKMRLLWTLKTIKNNKYLDYKMIESTNWKENWNPKLSNQITESKP